MLNRAWIAGHACKMQFNHHHVSQLWEIVAKQLEQEKAQVGLSILTDKRRRRHQQHSSYSDCSGQVYLKTAFPPIGLLRSRPKRTYRNQVDPVR
jgi:hypothetical protein